MSCIKLEDVRAILPPGVSLTDQALQMAVTSAACTLEEIADCIVNKSATCKAQIEIYLAAHYAAATDATLTIKSEKDGCSKASATYGFEFGEGIKGTPFGINANTMSGGCLAELDKQPISFVSVGCS